MKEEEEKEKFDWFCMLMGVGTAVPPHARAVPSFWNMRVGFGRVRHGRATVGTGRAKLLVMLGLIFFLFSYHIWTNTYKTN